ncbi:carbonic anhydrase-related protein 10 [Dermatophagoides farinae]|uniref:carbonic anhydrase-related protein 10 n=1 Tax=Dermatophagoides farinae TaxID=6954 RepID=UPI003F5DED29
MSPLINLPITVCRLIIFIQFQRFILADWESWWTYEGISGPDFWGRLNPKWSHCSKGQRQSPIDIDTSTLLFDPYLEPIKINGDYVRGQLVNTGRGISLLVDRSTTSSGGDKHVTISNGPFSYQYTVSNITLHFGRENDRGSEHTIDGKRFPGELQLYAYNSQLYSNWSEAKREPNGLVAISIFIMVSGHPGGQMVTSNVGVNNNDNHHQHHNQHHHHHHHHQQQQQQPPNAALKQITGLLKNITKRGLSYQIESLSIMDLLPSSWKHYVTYEGSITQPACYETVQWVILNRPIYLSSYQFHMLRHSLKGDGHQDNFRPTQPRNKRSIRCNIVYENIGGTGDDGNHHHSSNTMISNDIQQKQRKRSSSSSSLNNQELNRMADHHHHHHMDNNGTNESNLEFDHKSQTNKWQTIKIKREKQNSFVNHDSDYDDNHNVNVEYNVQKLSSSTDMDSNNNNNDDDDDVDDNVIDNNNQINQFAANLLAVKDEKFCLPDQLRLYGYRANPKMIQDEF